MRKYCLKNIPILLPVQGTLSSNYPYTRDSWAYCHWEANLNISQKSFTLFLTNADRSRTELLIRYTNENVYNKPLTLS